MSPRAGTAQEPRSLRLCTRFLRGVSVFFTFSTQRTLHRVPHIRIWNSEYARRGVRLPRRCRNNRKFLFATSVERRERLPHPNTESAV